MTPENSFQDPVLEQALSEIRDEALDPAVVEAAGNRVWARLAEAAGQLSGEPIRGCAGFQALLADYRAGRLPQGRAMLVEDHLHSCVACRHVYEGKVVTMPAARPAARHGARSSYAVRWAAAAAVILAAAGVTWTVMNRSGAPGERARVEAVSGVLYQVAADGVLRPLAVGQNLPDGVEIRTAKDSDALLRLADGSQVELRERSSLFTAASANDLTIRLGRGSVMVEAAKRRKGHLFVDTGDCRVAVTGTIFGVSAGVKGSRVSVVQGEVHVAQGSGETVLHRGDQTVTGVGMDPEPVRDDIAWSRNHDRYYALLADLRASLERIHLPDLRYQSNLLNRLPASTALYVSIPNLGDYLSQAQAVLNRKIAESPELAPFWNERGGKMQPVIDNLRAASSYLGGEILIVVLATPDGKPQQAVFVSELKRDGFADFLQQHGVPLTVEVRNGLVAFGPDHAAVENLATVFDSPTGGFEGTPFHARVAQIYREGAGLFVCADLTRLGQHSAGMSYFVAEEKEVNQQMEMRATLGFDPAHSGIAAWLANPAPMGSLDYVSPEAGTVAAFVVRDPAEIADLVGGVVSTTRYRARRPGGALRRARHPEGLKAALTGRSIGLLGPNGAGKSTLINTLLGFHKPSAGTARISGRDIRTQAARGAQPDRLHAGKRRLHRQHDRRALRAPDGRTGRPAQSRTRHGARPRGLLLRGPGRSPLPRAGHLLAGHEAGRQAGAGHRARPQAAVSRRAHQRPRSAGARAHDPAHSGNPRPRRSAPDRLLAPAARRGRVLRRGADPQGRQSPPSATWKKSAAPTAASWNWKRAAATTAISWRSHRSSGCETAPGAQGRIKLVMPEGWKCASLYEIAAGRTCRSAASITSAIRWKIFS
jgi:energy-coupling factor transporter ATP-binding protein EcfA2